MSGLAKFAVNSYWPIYIYTGIDGDIIYVLYTGMMNWRGHYYSSMCLFYILHLNWVILQFFMKLLILLYTSRQHTRTAMTILLWQNRQLEWNYIIINLTGAYNLYHLNIHQMSLRCV